VATSQLIASGPVRPTSASDDADTRPGSATSLLRTIGCYLRRLGGWIAGPALTELMTTVGVTQARTRTAILGVRSKGLLQTAVRNGSPGYALGPAALPALVRGDRRIYTPHRSARTTRISAAAMCTR
jgi:DNA-binding transcriptional regulator PaaX